MFSMYWTPRKPSKETLNRSDSLLPVSSALPQIVPGHRIRVCLQAWVRFFFGKMERTPGHGIDKFSSFARSSFQNLYIFSSPQGGSPDIIYLIQ